MRLSFPTIPDLNVQALWRPQTISELDSAMDMTLTGQPTFTGVNVSETLAMNFTAFYACVKVLSETMQSLPVQLKQRQQKGGARDAEELPLYTLVYKQPNDDMTSADLFGASMVHECTFGNTYIWLDVPRIGRNAGQIARMIPLKPEKVKPRRENGRLKYDYKIKNDDGSTRDVTYDVSQILHIPGMSWDGVMGLSPVSCARQAIGLGLALEEFQGRFFANGAHIKGIVTTPPMAPQAYEAFKKSFLEAYQGLQKAGSMMFANGAEDFKPFTMPLEDAELLASRKFTLEEMARIHRIPLHLVQNLDKATFSNIEFQSLEFVMFTMLPWLRRYEQRMDMRLLTDSEKRQGYFFKFNIKGLLRGDMKAQAEGFKLLREIGVYNPNDILKRLDENPREDPGGEKYWDTGPSGQGQQASQRDSEPSQEQAGAAVRSLMEPVLADCMSRISRRQEDIIEEAGRRAKKQDADGMKSWLEGFYQRHESDAEGILSSYFKALNEPERAKTEAQTVVETLRISLESVDILDQQAVATAIKGADAA